mmetsp:Transcript_26806/g.58798  ORF Transcript_26806/g.58798 Transcript_26806/m.58798 type:complete len:316 (-) Transcript_26806:933-1880(-)
MKLCQFGFSFAILSLLFRHNISLQVDESCRMFFQDDLWRAFRYFNDSRLHMFLQNTGKPILQLHGISNGGTESQHRTVACLNDSLEGISLGTIQGVHLVKNEVIKLVEPTIENHEFTFTLGHFITGNTTYFAQTSFQCARSSDVNLSFTGDFLEGNLFRTNGDISLEELVVKGCYLPHQYFTGKDEEDGSVRIFTGVCTKNSFSRGGRGTNHSRFSVVYRLQNIELPGFELQLSVVTTEWRKTIRHFCQLEGNQVFLATHELASELQGVSVRPAVITALFVKLLQGLSFRGEDNLDNLGLFFLVLALLFVFLVLL